MERSTMLLIGKLWKPHYFDWAIFNSKLLVYPRVNQWMASQHTIFARKIRQFLLAFSHIFDGEIPAVGESFLLMVKLPLLLARSLWT